MSNTLGHRSNKQRKKVLPIGAKFKKKYLWHTKPKGVMMMLKYSLFVFCFLLAGYSCVSGHKETKTSASRPKQRAQTLCAQDSVIQAPKVQHPTVHPLLMRTPLMQIRSIHPLFSQKDESASTLIPKHQKSPMVSFTRILWDS